MLYVYIHLHCIGLRSVGWLVWLVGSTYLPTNPVREEGGRGRGRERAERAREEMMPLYRVYTVVYM